ncbi:MAG: hypothetical protein IKC94_03825 [Lentisphaeria bacterium]|nr:hypothetical protein [Lentisphaeria bacterium]
MKKILLAISALLFCISLHARVRVDVQCAAGVTIKSIQAPGFSTVTTPAKAVDNVSRAVLISGNLNAQWSKFEFSFIPEKSGHIVLRFHTPGARNAANLKPVRLDDVQASGATLLNGSFELMHNRRLTNWKIGAKGRIITGEKAFEGQQCAEVIFNSGMAIQDIIVTEGEKVTVSFMVKPAE